MSTVADVTLEAQVLLNDVAGKIYTQAVLLPLENKAYRELQQKVANVGGSVIKEQTASITIPTNTKVIVFGATLPAPALPPTLLYPISLYEKISGQDDSTYIPMKERGWVPFTSESTRLMYWTWIDDEIRLVGAINPVPIVIRYMGGLADLADDTDDILILDSLTYLASRTAALAAYVIGSSPTRGQVLQSDADEAEQILLNKIIKNRQGLPVRRRKFKAFRWRPFFGR